MFKRAVPVWEKNKCEEKNYELLFRCQIEQHADVQLIVATSCEYQLWINGTFAAFGPAKAAHGFFKADTIHLDTYLTKQINTVVLKAVSANINSFAVLEQPPFVTAEIVSGQNCIAWTGKDGGFLPYYLGNRVQKVQRYSYQRTFTEVYRVGNAEKEFLNGSDNWETVQVICVEPRNYIPRDVRYPQYKETPVIGVVEQGGVNFEQGCENPIRDRALININPFLKGFTVDELDEPLSDEIQEFGYIPHTATDPQNTSLNLADMYATLEYPFNMTGFVKFSVSCEQSCTVYVLFDEILSGGDVDFLRLTNCNVLKYYVEPGVHSIVSFEPYTMKYIKFIVKGSAQITDIAMIQFKHPEVPYVVALPDDVDLKLIYDAALETYQANAMDMFYDCPSRERAGWLCDSFFTARVEHVLTGESVLERAFLKNFLMVDHYPGLPEGAMPMCYPADHFNGEHIPNWIMWYILELEEYYQRTQDTELVELAKAHVYNVLKYFKKFENKDGLLEKLPSWVFVEWSAANDWVQDINFPSNMLYARMLQAVANLYADQTLADQSKALMEKVRERSFNGQFFTDHEIYREGVPENPGHISEVCQYYAFFTGVATKEEYPDLWNTLVENFGPHRPEEVYPMVAPANAFIGDYLRLELLHWDGKYEQLLADMKGYFAPMAKQTGTLWEHNLATASCCHGFASHVIYWLDKIYGKVKV